MDELVQHFQRPEWYRATSLTERLELLRSDAGIDSNEELGERHMRLWRSQAPFSATTARRRGNRGRIPPTPRDVC